jgi:hypothetical protein
MLCEVHLCVTVRSASLWKSGFYCVCIEHNLIYFIVYLITYADLCSVCSADGEVLCPWVHGLQQ